MHLNVVSDSLVWLMSAMAPPQNNNGAWQRSCLSKRSPAFQYRAGIIIGTMQLVAGIFSIILSGVSYAYNQQGVVPYPAVGIWAGILFYIPAGILGFVAKKRHTYLVTLYMTWCIMAAVIASVMIIIEFLVAGVESFVFFCKRFLSLLPFNWLSVTDDFIELGCSQLGMEESAFIHGLLVFIGCVEFVVSVVASAFICDALFFQKSTKRSAALP